MSDLFDPPGAEPKASAERADPFAGPPPIPPEKAPRTAAERLAWLRLARTPGVGPATFVRLLRRYPSAAAALEAVPELSARGGGPRAPAPVERIEAEIAAGERAHARLLCLGAPDYPALLAQADGAPPILWALGDPSRLRAPAVALVGARNASAVGRRWAEATAAALAERGALIVSGLARGIDAAAHRGALRAAAEAAAEASEGRAGGPGTTVAAVAGGVDHVYPPEHAALHAEMVERGAVISEMPMGFQPAAQHFPRRNRLISGLSQVVVVVEAAERSGAMITARYAAEQNREAAAVPGHPLDPRYGGCNALLRQGATLVRDADDVWEALDQSRPRRLLEPGAFYDPALQLDAEEPANAEAEPPADLADRALAMLSTAPIEIDALVRALDVAPAALAAALLELELAGRIERRPGGLLARSPEGI